MTSTGGGIAAGRKPEVWFLTGSQHLYGAETLEQVADQSQQIQRMLSGSGRLSVTSGRRPPRPHSRFARGFAAPRTVLEEAPADATRPSTVRGRNRRHR